MTSKELQQLEDDQWVCYCSKVSKETVKNAIIAGACTVEELQESTGAGIGKRCKELNPSGRCCHPDLKELINVYGQSTSSDTSSQNCCCCKSKEK
jgi:NAD(P)H-nitrite reductase large subunit